jgi:hypothetical protein
VRAADFTAGGPHTANASWSLLECHCSAVAVASALALSCALGLTAIALGWPLTFIAVLSVLPWNAILARKVRGDGTRYGVLAIFELLVVLQLAHFAEHVAQMAELHLLDWPAGRATGIVGALDGESVHWWWNTLVLATSTALLLHFRRNTWLRVSWIFALWHEIEHLYLYGYWYLLHGVAGHAGILGADGLLDQAGIAVPLLTDLSRADLHFWYNFFEISLIAIAFFAQARRLYGVPDQAPANRSRALAGLGLVQVPLVLFCALIFSSPVSVRVPEQYATIQQAIDAAPAGAIIRVAPGTYVETLTIDKPLSLIGDAGGATRIGGDHTVTVIHVTCTHDVTLKQLSVVGGEYGILVDESEAVNITDNHVLFAWFAGIRLSRASAQITGNEVRATMGPYGMGIELANTVSRPPVLVRANTISASTHEGIVMHNAHAVIEKNEVQGNGLRGIAIIEMSMASVWGNTLTGNADAGIYAEDMSMVDIYANRIAGMRAGPEGDANGIRAVYHAEVTLDRNQIDGEPTQAVVSRSKAHVARRPLP